MSLFRLGRTEAGSSSAAARGFVQPSKSDKARNRTHEKTRMILPLSKNCLYVRLSSLTFFQFTVRLESLTYFAQRVSLSPFLPCSLSPTPLPYGCPSEYVPLPARLSLPCRANSSQTVAGNWSGGVMATMLDSCPPVIGP